MNDRLKYYVDPAKCGVKGADDVATALQGRFPDVRIAVGPQSLNERNISPELKPRLAQVTDYYEHIAPKEKAEK